MSSFFSTCFKVPGKKSDTWQELSPKMPGQQYTRMTNVQFIQELSGLSPWDYSSWRVLKENENTAVTANKDWRMTLLVKQMDDRKKKEAIQEDIRLSLQHLMLGLPPSPVGLLMDTHF